MGLKQTDEVDVISFNKDDGVVTLGIIDTMDWNAIDEHLMLLQEKLNVYLSFLESGEIYSQYEVANGSEFEIKIYF
ncbi:DUF6572 domain-containing protein [Sutcliffiella horikoshii]|uniref:DUF6572 domain-containing protein n=1 Tax=Sutcliffiella horikoshii TaxID=79883 RepID=UPI001F420ACA|nr:DUF6572 domain-containing protein [Sutcliffiella horikoshii]MCG1021465.1 hypothetical protein [Sutcliffiella horikoshii]